MRLFAGLELPEEVRGQLAALERGIPGARWLDPDQLHLTVAFVGEVDRRTAVDVSESLAELRIPSLEIEIAGVGHFGPLRRARTVWAGVSPTPPLLRLRKATLRRLEAAGAVVERRRYRPHVTLARIRGETGHHLANFLAERNLMRIPAFRAGALTLFESRLHRDGATYSALERYPLLEPAPA